MNPLKLTLVFLFFASSNVFSQSDHDRTVLSKLLIKVLISNFPSKKCQTVDLATSTLVISINRKGIVKRIDSYNLPACEGADTVKFIAQLKESINELSINTKEYRNKSIVYPILFVNEEKKLDAVELQKFWMYTYSSKAFDMDRKELKFIIPVTVQIFLHLNEVR